MQGQCTEGFLEQIGQSLQYRVSGQRGKSAQTSELLQVPKSG